MPRTIFGLDGWRWVVIIGSIGALIIWWIRRGLPESPRWLAQHGRIAEAERIVEELERRSRAETGAELPAPQLVAGEAERKPGAWMEMWSPVYRGRTIMLVVFHLFQTIGYYGFSSWVVTLLSVAGHRGDEIARLYVHHRHGRAGRAAGRHLFRRPLRAQMAGGLLRRSASPRSACCSRSRQRPLGVIACGLLITLCGNWFSFSFHAYQAELYPTRIRAQAVGFVYSWSRFSAIFSGFLIAFFLGRYGTIGVFSFIAGAMVVVFIVISLFGPAVTRRRLEAIAA